MSATLDPQRFAAARAKAIATLLDARTADRHWEGELSSSALSTATAVTALAIFRREFNPRGEGEIPLPSGAAARLQLALPPLKS